MRGGSGRLVFSGAFGDDPVLDLDVDGGGRDVDAPVLRGEVILPRMVGRGYAALRSMAAGDLYPSAEWRRWVL